MKRADTMTLRISAKPTKNEGFYLVSASLGDDLVHRAKGVPGDLAFRREFADALCQTHPALPRPKVEKALEHAAASVDEDLNARTKAPSARDRLVAIGRSCDLFRGTRGGHAAGFVSVKVNGVVQTFPITSASFRQWLSQEYLRQHNRVPSSGALVDAATALAGIALNANARHEIAVRVARDESALFIDLGDADGSCAVVRRSGWKIVSGSKAPVRFVQPEGQLPLARPERGGSVRMLKEVLNLPKSQWKPCLGWAVFAFSPDGPYPMLVVNGEHGSGKSSLCRTMRALVDPNAAPLRQRPRNPHELMLAAQNSRVIALDNLSGVSPILADGLCSLATGAAMSVRMLYRDDQEVLFSAQRPIIVNGIDDLCTRPDLADRAVQLVLPTISPTDRACEADLTRAFEAIKGKVLGALFDGLACALLNHERVSLPELPRMADFARFVSAAEEAFGWKAGSFARALNRNRAAADEIAVEASPIGRALLQLVQQRGEIEVSMEHLLRTLRKRVPEAAQRERDFPKSAVALAKMLRRIAPNLRGLGIDCELNQRKPDRHRTRFARLRWRGSDR